MNLIKRFISSIILLSILSLSISIDHKYFNIFLILIFLLALYEWLNLVKMTIHKLFGSFFLFLSFYSVFLLSDINNISSGTNLIILIIIICVSSDIGGYVFGKILRGPKLTKISPNKTYSGVLGAYLFVAFSIFVISANELIFFKKITFSNLLIIALLISSISQIGDIIISFFKRKAKIKDTGKLIPGHGGILDRIDGMIFAFPFSLIFLHLCKLKKKL